MRYAIFLAAFLAFGVTAAHAGDVQSEGGKSDLTKKLEEKLPGNKAPETYLDKAPETNEESEPKTVTDPVSETFTKNYGRVKHDPNCDKPGINC